jgi:acetyltransferase
MRISGPNAEGFYSQVQQVAATFSPTVDIKPGATPLVATKKRIGIVAQSGGIGFAFYHRAKALGIAVSYVVSTGNESDLGAGEFLNYMVRDPTTDVIVLFIEGVRDIEKFLRAAQRAAEIRKPVIVTKVGRSGAGERAATSHTASMAGWSAAYDAVFAKYGFIVSNDLDEVMTIAAVLTTSPLPKGDRVAVLTVSGGAGIWGADTVSLQGLKVPELSAPIQTEIMKLLPSYGTARNPIDVTAQGVHTGGLQRSIDLLSASGEVDAILVVLSLSSETRMPFKQAELKPVLDAQRKPVVFYSYTLPSEFARRELAASGAVVLSGLTHVATALWRSAEYANFKAPAVRDASLPERDLSAWLKSPLLSEADSKALLRAAGIALAEDVLVTDKGGLNDALARVGFPLVMKIQSPDIPHKSEVGGVRVNIATKGEVFLAFEEIVASARKARPDAAIQGVLVAPMAKAGVEIIIGTLQDNTTFGPMVMVGLGGITTELFRDTVYRPAPVSADEAAAMLDQLKAAPLLKGFRGAAKADIPALAQLIAQISLLAARLRGTVAEIEVNPVRVHPQGEGVTVVDALVVRRT